MVESNTAAEELLRNPILLQGASETQSSFATNLNKELDEQGFFKLSDEEID